MTTTTEVRTAQAIRFTSEDPQFPAAGISITTKTDALDGVSVYVSEEDAAQIIAALRTPQAELLAVYPARRPYWTQPPLPGVLVTNGEVWLSRGGLAQVSFTRAELSADVLESALSAPAVEYYW